MAHHIPLLQIKPQRVFFFQVKSIRKKPAHFTRRVANSSKKTEFSERLQMQHWDCQWCSAHNLSMINCLVIVLYAEEWSRCSLEKKLEEVAEKTRFLLMENDQRERTPEKNQAYTDTFIRIF